MKKKVMVCILLLIIIIIVNAIFPLKAFCLDDIENIIKGMEDTKKGDTSSSKITQSINTIFSLIRYVGTGICIIVVMMLAIKYMVASVADKAEIKKQAVPVVIGCVLIFATFNIVSFVLSIVDSVQK